MTYCLNKWNKVFSKRCIWLTHNCTLTIPVPYSFFLWTVLKDSVLFTRTSQNRRIIQGENDLRRSLVQLSAQNRIDYEIRLGCSEHNPVIFWKPPGMETTQLLWVTCSTAGLSSWTKCFSLCPVRNSPVIICACCYALKGLTPSS